MINKNIIQAIGKKEMTRKDFLKFSSLAVLSLVGVGRVVSLLTQPTNSKNVAVNGPNQQQAQMSHGYGGGAYGK